MLQYPKFGKIMPLSVTCVIRKPCRGSPCLILLVILRIIYTFADFGTLTNPTGTLLKGPTNQSILIGQKARFQCRILDRHLYGITPDEIGQNFNKQLSVQWILDGFGVTNETLKSVYGTRYRMPGPADQGVYDLVIDEVTFEDEASLICQADVKLYKSSPPPLIETLTSKPAFLKIIIPPIGLTLARRTDRYSHINPQSPGSKFDRLDIISQSFVKSHLPPYTKPVINRTQQSQQVGNSRIVADDPAIDVFQNTHLGNSQFNYQSMALNETREQAFTDRQQLRTPVLWIREQEPLIIECRSSAAKPAPIIRWFLAGTLLDPVRGGQMDRSIMQDITNSQSSSKSSQVEVNEKFEITEQTFVEPLNFSGMPVQPPPLFMAKNTSVTEELQAKASLSVLQLIVQRRHKQNRLECKIGNSGEFQAAELPAVAAIIEPMYVERIDIRVQDDKQTEEMREGTTAHFHCKATTNPPSPIYSWTILDPPNDSDIYHNNKTATNSQYTNQITSRDRLLNPIPQDPSIVHIKLHRSMHRSRIRCWVGVGIPDEDIPTQMRMMERKNKHLIWKKVEKELNIIYGPTFEQSSDTILPAKLGKTIYLECAVDANPVAHVTLYRIGPRGQAMLNELSDLRAVDEEDIDQGNQSSISSRHSKVGTRELSSSALAKAIKSKGTELLVTTTQKVRYPLHLKSMEDFGFYACLANNPSFSTALQPIYVGDSGPPKITHILQVNINGGSQIELICLIKSVPRPNSDRILWYRNDRLQQPNERISIFNERLILGLKSILHFQRVELEDVALYNCSVTNEYGTAWKAIQLDYGATVPIIFIAGTGVALLLAVLFVLLLCCFFRRSRRRGGLHLHSQSKDIPKQLLKNNGVQFTHTETNPNFGYEMELQPMLATPISEGNFPMQYDALNMQTCHLCLNTVPTTSDTARTMESIVGNGCPHMNCKRSDDSGIGTSELSGQPNSTLQNGFPTNSTAAWNTVVLRAPSPQSPQSYYSLLSPRRSVLYGETFSNRHAPGYFHDAQTNMSYHKVYDSVPTSNAPATAFNRIQPCQQTISPILVVTPNHTNNTNVFQTPVSSSGILLPSAVLFQPQTVITLPQSPQKPVYCAVPTSCSSFIPTTPDDSANPEMSVLPLSFCGPTSVSILSESPVITTDLPHPMIHVNTLIHSRSSDDDGTTV